MAYLFDTNHCIYLMNGWNKPKTNLSQEERNTVESFKGISNDVVYMCEASVGELIYGIERSQRKEYNRKNFESLILAIPSIPVSRSTWKIYGETKAELSMIGKKVPDIDLLIAATAKKYNLILVARDKHMRNLPHSFIRENWASIE